MTHNMSHHLLFMLFIIFLVSPTLVSITIYTIYKFILIYFYFRPAHFFQHRISKDFKYLFSVSFINLTKMFANIFIVLFIFFEINILFFFTNAALTCLNLCFISLVLLLSNEIKLSRYLNLVTYVKCWFSK